MAVVVVEEEFVQVVVESRKQWQWKCRVLVEGAPGNKRVDGCQISSGMVWPADPRCWLLHCHSLALITRGSSIALRLRPRRLARSFAFHNLGI